MHPYYVQDKTTGAQFLVLDRMYISRIIKDNVAFTHVLCGIDLDGNDVTLNPDDMKFVGLMPPGKPPATDAETGLPVGPMGVTSSGLILPFRPKR
jgi:hypothetical protein